MRLMHSAGKGGWGGRSVASKKGIDTTGMFYLVRKSSSYLFGGKTYKPASALASGKISRLLLTF